MLDNENSLGSPTDKVVTQKTAPKEKTETKSSPAEKPLSLALLSVEDALLALMGDKA